MSARCSSEIIKGFAVFFFPNIITTCLSLFPQPSHGYCGFFAQMKIRSKGKTSGTRLKTNTSDLLLFQKQLDDRIRLFEEETETENVVANKVKLLFF